MPRPICERTRKGQIAPKQKLPPIPVRPPDAPEPWWDDLKARWKANLQPFIREHR